MDLQQLAYFRTVARLENMTKAANELHITQPSLSVAISKLEDELGAKLFDRISGRIRLNHLGERFYRQADRILLAVQDAQQEMADCTAQGSKLVQFAVTVSNQCTELLTEFMREHRDYQIHHFLHTEANALALLETGDVDFVVGARPLISPLIEWQTLNEDRLCLLTGRDTPCAKESLLSVAQLQTLRYVVMRSAFHPEGEFAGFFQEAGFQPEVVFTTNEFETMAAMVELDVGVSIVSEVTAKKLLSNSKRHLAAIPLDTDYKGRTIGIAKLKGHYMTKAVQEFFDFTVQFFQA